ncbi:SelT/SelW/SelH family protein [Salinibacillus xinjiangensis]|uniref:SelT/SelW/SelH family protein n=1 Tax=Salinibacillus xinjiangensis TaxID=1229268 RepID=A0A6G1X2X4_9BACI|nr:SelT/SelW/SelH family protein [Salinibacillus xinjiangensis]
MKLVPSSGGVFEVTVNDTKIYSKKETGQFPESEKMIQELEKLKNE